MKYSKALCDKIVEYYATGKHTIEDICKHVGISEAVFYKWKSEKVEFLEALKAVNDKRLSNLGEMAVSGLALLLTKHEYEEVTTEYYEGKDGKPKIKSQKKVKKFIMPNASIVQYTLNNRLPDDWKTKQLIGGDPDNPLPSPPEIKVYNSAPPLATDEKEVNV